MMVKLSVHIFSATFGEEPCSILPLTDDWDVSYNHAEQAFYFINFRSTAHQVYAIISIGAIAVENIRTSDLNWVKNSFKRILGRATVLLSNTGNPRRQYCHTCRYIHK